MRQESSIQTISPYSVKATEDNMIKSPKPDSEVPEKRPRRRFTAQYKLRILDEVDASTDQGHIGSILRREGLYYSNIRNWRQQRDQGVLHGLSPKKRGRKAKEVHPLAKRVAELELKNQRLQKKLKQAETIIEVQKKVSEILGIPLDETGERK